MDSILLVDDDLPFLQGVHLALETAGYDVFAAESSEEALRIAGETPCAVMVAAVELKDGTGPLLVREMADVSADTECILLASNPDISVLVDLYDLGNVFGHRWKPLEDFSDLARDLARAMERRQLKRQNAHLLTELRDVRDEIRCQAEFLVQVEKMAALGQMAGDLAEELDAPLASLVDYAAYFQRAFAARASGTDAKSRQLAGMVREMVDAATRCQRVVRGVYTFAEGSGRPVESVDLNELVNDTCDLLRHSLDRRSIELVVNLADGPPPVAASRSLLQQVLTHVALNAMHAMPEGGTLTVETEVFVGEPGGLHVRIGDTGFGIDDETLPHIFEPFFTTRPFGTGTGLGLTIARAITREYDGEICVESEVGKGTTFTLTFPAVEAMAPPSAVRTSAA